MAAPNNNDNNNEAISTAANKDDAIEANEKAKEEDEQEQPLYFSKDGRPRFGVTVPAAFALRYPYPPLPSNLAKNRVLRAKDEQSKESLQEGIIQAEKEFEKEAMPLPTLTQVQGSPLPKVLIPEIELALYWDRHPYEFRSVNGTEKENKTAVDSGRSSVDRKQKQNGESPPTKNSSGPTSSSLRRSKSEMNLASQVGEILKEEGNSTRRSSLSSSVKHSRDSNASSVKSYPHKGNHSKPNSPRNNHHHREPSPSPSSVVQNNHNHNQGNSSCHSNGKCGSDKGDNKRDTRSDRASIDGSLKSNRQMQMSESERKKFEDIKLFHQSNNNQHKKSNQTEELLEHSRPKLIRSAEQAQREGLRKSAGIQVTLDDVTAAALKSTYLCPLHGQYRRGIERREKSGFRTDMSSVANPHSHCSRALKGVPSRTKLIKSSETQTDDELPVQPSQEVRTRRSKTALQARNLKSKVKDVMASEYHGSFRNPYQIADSEKRHLRNKILSYCFTKHSIF